MTVGPAQQFRLRPQPHTEQLLALLANPQWMNHVKLPDRAAMETREDFFATQFDPLLRQNDMMNAIQ